MGCDAGAKNETNTDIEDSYLWSPVESINLVFQDPRALERDYSPGIERQILSRGRVSSLPRSLLLGTKPSKSADQDFISGFQWLLDQLKNSLNQNFRFLLGEPALIVERLDKITLYKGHSISWD